MVLSLAPPEAVLRSLLLPEPGVMVLPEPVAPEPCVMVLPVPGVIVLPEPVAPEPWDMVPVSVLPGVVLVLGVPPELLPAAGDVVVPAPGVAEEPAGPAPGVWANDRPAAANNAALAAVVRNLVFMKQLLDGESG